MLYFLDNFLYMLKVMIVIRRMPTIVFEILHAEMNDLILQINHPVTNDVEIAFY